MMHGELRIFRNRISYGRVECKDLVSCRIKRMMACAELVRAGPAARYSEHNLLMKCTGVRRAACERYRSF